MATKCGKWQVKSVDAIKMARELALKEGLLVIDTKYNQRYFKNKMVII